jgi:acetylornithine deacetylase/succinyl-diaminopimelate desuccinylase-like protein
VEILLNVDNLILVSLLRCLGLVYDKNRLLEIVKKDEQSEMGCLKKLIGIPTCVNKNHDMKPIVAQLTQEFEKRGYTVQTFSMSGSGSPIIVAEMNLGMDRTLMFYNHYDVQPEEPLEDWKTLPYTLTIKNERLYARGVNDDKGPLVANIFGVQVASKAGYELKCNIRFIIEGEEEVGGTSLEEFCKAHPNLLKADGCIWEEAYATRNQRSELYAGVKGDVYFELHAKGVHIDAHSSNAPMVVNPAWRLVWALSTLKNEKEEILIDGYYDDVVPPRKKELQLFEKYPSDLIEQYKLLYKTDKFLLGRDGVEFWKELLLRPTCTICGLSAGYEGPGSKTVIGKEATAKLDFRVVPNQKVERLEKLLKKHLDMKGFSDIEIQLLTGYGPSRTPVDHPFIVLLTELAKNFTEIDPVVFPSHQASGPAYLFGPYTPWVMCSTADPEANGHAPNESMRLSDFKYMTAFVGAIATELGRS